MYLHYLRKLLCTAGKDKSVDERQKLLQFFGRHRVGLFIVVAVIECRDGRSKQGMRDFYAVVKC